MSQDLMFARLLEAVDTVSIPGAPPQMSQLGARIGLSFLETALRLNHTRRFTEEVTFDYVGVAHRKIRQEVSLDFLHPTQVKNGQDYADYRAATLDTERIGRSATTLWVPLARVSRFSSPPVVVRLDDDTILPTLTRGESAELLVPAIYRLFRRVIDLRAAVDPSDDLIRLLRSENESRWLLQQALISLILERAPVSGQHKRIPHPDTEPATGARQRQLLRTVLVSLKDQGALNDLCDLLQIAVDETLLVAGFGLEQNENEVAYELPVQRVGSASRARLWANDYVVDYITVIPSGVNSYHLTVTTSAAQIQVRDAALLVPSAESQVKRIAADLDYLSDEVRLFRAGQVPRIAEKMLEYELQHELKSLADILRRRLWESEWQRIAIANNGPTSLALAAAASEGYGRVDLAGKSRVDASLLQHPAVTADALAQASVEVGRLGLGTEVCLDTTNEAPSANLFWRRSEIFNDPRGDLPAICRLRIVDRFDDGLASVRRFAIALILTGYVLNSGTFQSLWPAQWLNYVEKPIDIEAKVAVLLLVPGFLFTRLDASPRGSIGARLKTGPRMVAYTYIVISVLSALNLASVENGYTRALAAVSLFVAQLVLFGVLLIPLRRSHKGYPSIIGVEPPRWVARAARTERLFRRSDDAFRAVGPED